MTDSVIDLILTRLLTERDRLNRVESANVDLRNTLFQVRDLCDASDDTLLVELLRHQRTELDRLRDDARRIEALELGEVRAAVDAALVALGISPSGNLRLDAENLRRLVVTMRSPMSALL